MPTYVYHCDRCNNNFEVIQKFSDNPLTSCPHGHEGVRRVITPSAIIFKGSGWYINDSKAKTSTSSSAATKSNEGGDKGEKAASGESSSDSGSSSETKSESKSDSKSETKSDSKPSTTSAT